MESEDNSSSYNIIDPSTVDKDSLMGIDHHSPSCLMVYDSEHEVTDDDKKEADKSEHANEKESDESEHEVTDDNRKEADESEHDDEKETNESEHEIIGDNKTEHEVTNDDKKESDESEHEVTDDDEKETNESEHEIIGDNKTEHEVTNDDKKESDESEHEITDDDEKEADESKHESRDNDEKESDESEHDDEKESDESEHDDEKESDESEHDDEKESDESEHDDEKESDESEHDDEKESDESEHDDEKESDESEHDNEKESDDRKEVDASEHEITDDESEDENSTPDEFSMMVDKIKRKMQCDGRTVKFTRSFFESLKSISLEDIQNFLDPKSGYFLEEIEKNKESIIINKTIELEYEMGDDKGLLKMTVVANKMNYGKFIGYYIRCDVTYNYEKGISCHPFRHIKAIDETGEYVSDNNCIRTLLNNLVDEEALNTQWGSHHKTEVVANLILSLSYLWD